MQDMSKQSRSISFGKWKIFGSNTKELQGIKKEIIGESIYYVDINNDTPSIIDAGAHVGLATFYFKSIWPKARITCIEPHPENIKYLQYNLWLNHLDDVYVKKEALGNKRGERPLYYDASSDKWFSTAGFTKGAWDHTQQSKHSNVPTITLSSLLNKPVDIVKLDIEGVETEVICESAKFLKQIHHLILEYHPLPSNSWEKLISTLTTHDFHSSNQLPSHSPKKLTICHFINHTFSS